MPQMLRQIQSSYLANHLVLLEPQKGQDYRQCLVEFFEEESIVLAVTGSRDSPNPFPTAGGMTAAKRLTGSTAMYLANTAPCPMVITRKAIGDNHFFSRPRHVVIALAPAVPGAAGPALDDHIVSFATANLLLGNDVVTVTSVVADEAHKAACEAALAGPMAKIHAFQASYSEHESKPKCQLHVFVGNAAEIVMSCVKSAKPRVDLLVCGTRGHTGVKKLFLGRFGGAFDTAPRGHGGGTDMPDAGGTTARLHLGAFRDGVALPCMRRPTDLTARAGAKIGDGSGAGWTAGTSRNR